MGYFKVFGTLMKLKLYPLLPFQKSEGLEYIIKETASSNFMVMIKLISIVFNFRATYSCSSAEDIFWNLRIVNYQGISKIFLRT